MICIDDVYGGSQRYFRKIVAPTYGITFSFMDMNGDGLGLLADVLEKSTTTKLIWLESPTNPTLKVTDIAAVAAVGGLEACIDLS